MKKHRERISKWVKRKVHHVKSLEKVLKCSLYIFFQIYRKHKIHIKIYDECGHIVYNEYINDESCGEPYA